MAVSFNEDRRSRDFALAVSNRAVRGAALQQVFVRIRGGFIGSVALCKLTWQRRRTGIWCGMG